MFSIIRNTITTQAERNAAKSEIFPDSYLERAADIRWANIKETAGIISALALGAVALLFWLAYEGVITPEMFN